MTDLQHNSIEDTARSAAKYLQYLDPGNLAELRRMRPPSVGAPAYWRLAARHSGTISRNHNAWLVILRSLAILTPRGEPESRPPLHNPSRRLGYVLCDGGDPDWPSTGKLVRPAISENRLAQLMSARGKQRQILLERAIRAIARTRRPESGINVVDIAWWLLSTDAERSTRQLAESYYQRLDRAEQEQPTTQNGANT